MKHGTAGYGTVLTESRRVRVELRALKAEVDLADLERRRLLPGGRGVRAEGGTGRQEGKAQPNGAHPSPPQVGTRRRIAAVDVLMAVLARVLDHPVARVRAGQGVAEVVQRSRMPRIQVAALAE